jgi:hypothetical protein
VTGLAEASCGVLVATADGALCLVDPTATRVVWRREGLGEGAGAPAAAGKVAAVADRGGRVRLFGLCDGAPAGSIELGAEPRFGLLGVDGRLVAALSDGRLWVHDPTSGQTQVDAHVKVDPRRPASDLGDGSIAVPVAPASLMVVPLPKR